MLSAVVREGAVLAGRYVLGAPLGTGAMGSVFRAKDLRLGGEVAIKVLHGQAAADDALVARLRNEARAAAALGNPHIVRVTDFQENAGEPPFIVMEKIDGVSLRTLVESNGRLPVHRACSIAVQMLAALDAAHAAGILHRDVKPENVLLASSPSGDVVKMVDFGLAHSFGDEHGSREIVGTFGFVAPEHLAGAPVGPSADLYAVGATLFYMLAGRHAFDGLRVEQWMAVAQARTPRLPAESLGLPEALATIVARAMAVRPEDRFHDARALIAALEPFTLARPTPIVTFDVPARSAHVPGSAMLPRIVLVGIVLAVVVIGFVISKSRAAKRGPLGAETAPAVTAR